ncbi:hypothetical protein [Mycolicibacterium sp. A43C]
MATKAEPRVIDFARVRTPDEDADDYDRMLVAIRGGRDDLRPYVPGRVHDHTRPVPAHRMRRARRILWECKQKPEWQRTQAAYYRHPSLLNVPYPVLKKLAKESEAQDGR